jgi:Uma2 family endonuclease
MAGQPAKSKRHHTWADIRALPEGVRAEIIDGELFDMSAAPALLHQQVLGELNDAFREHFKGEICQVFFAPVAVKLADDSVVEPDLLVVCDPHQLRGTHVEGAPALVVEILSPSSPLHDRWRKMRLYARAGVAEYWIIDPVARMVEIYSLDGAGYRLHGSFGPGETAAGVKFPKLLVTVNALFRFPPASGPKAGPVKEKRVAYRVKSRRTVSKKVGK